MQTRIPTYLVLGLALLVQRPCMAQLPSVAESKPEPQVSIFYLEHCKADEAAAMIGKLLRSDQLSVTTDVRLNAVIASGTKEDLQKLETLLEHIDVSIPAGTPKVSLLDRAIELTTAKSLVSALNLDVELATTSEGLILASEDVTALQQAEDMLEALTKTMQSSTETYSLQVFWITEEQDIEGTVPFEDPVSQKLAERGFKQLSLISQVTLTTRVGEDCLASGPAIAGSLRCDGELEQSSAGLSLRFQLTASRSQASPPTQIESNMIIQSGQWIVFGIVQSPTAVGVRNRDMFLIRVDPLQPL